MDRCVHIDPVDKQNPVIIIPNELCILSFPDDGIIQVCSTVFKP